MSGGEDTPPVVTIVDSNSTTPLLSTVSVETMNDEGGDEKDDAEAEQDKDMFKKKTYKNSGKLSHNKGFSSSFARKRKKVQ